MFIALFRKNKLYQESNDRFFPGSICMQEVKRKEKLETNQISGP